MTTRTGSAQPARAGWFELAAPSVIRLSGPDARRFCNGMFTNNARDLAVGASNRHALVDDRGRVLGFLDLRCESKDVFLATLDGISAAAFLERYEKFVVFDDVTLDDETGRWALFSVVGPGFAALLPGGERSWPSKRAPGGGADLLVPADAAASVRASLSSAAALAPADVERLRLLARRPLFPQDTGERSLPHELGLRDEILSFEKGCYVGQETINRVDVMGQVKRMLVVLEVSDGADLVGAQVQIEGAVVGNVTSAIAGVALAIVRKPHDAVGTELTLVVGSAQHRSVVVEPSGHA